MKKNYLPSNSLAELLDGSLKKDSKHILISSGKKKITRRELIEKILRVRGGLYKKGFRKGDKVISILDNSYEQIILFFACVTLGIIWVPVGSDRKGLGLNYIINKIKPKKIISKYKNSKNIPKRFNKKIFKISKNLKNLEFKKKKFEISNVYKTSCILFTSGTTGPPKGVMVSQKMLLASAYATSFAAEINQNDKLLLWESIHHIGGLQLIVLLLLNNFHLVITKKFSARNFWNQVRVNRITKIHYLGGILDILLKLKKDKKDKKHFVKLAFGAGCAVNTYYNFKKRFNIPLREVYGMTEASSFSTINFNNKKKSIGKALPWFNIKIKKKYNEKKIGEIVIKEKERGLITKGYFKNKEATKELLKKDGLHTGDLATIDRNNNIYYIGRLKDSVRVRGENISAWEIENTLNQNKNISESAILGIKAEIGEKEIVALLVSRTKEIDIIKIIRSYRKYFSKRYFPRYWSFVEKLPRTPTLRIDKKNIKINSYKLYDTAINKYVKLR